MIVGPANWETALAAAHKKPLYYLEIGDYQVKIASFCLEDLGLENTDSGYGVIQYGIGGYGT